VNARTFDGQARHWNFGKSVNCWLTWTSFNEERMRRNSVRPRSATKDQILDAAIRLFGERSFDAVSLRDITAAAKANLGAVNYHFGSKLNLIREVLKSLAAPINEERIALLSEYDASLNGARPDLETVIRILVGPFVRAARNKESRAVYYPRLLTLARTLPGNLIGSFISEQHDAMARRFIEAFGRAVPELEEEEAFWRYAFTIGAMLDIVGDSYRSYRIKRLSSGRCDTDDADRIIDELVTFVAAGMKGHAPARPMKKKLQKQSETRKVAREREAVQ
jgi:AcrR family transcriptional regulator